MAKSNGAMALSCVLEEGQARFAASAARLARNCATLTTCIDEWRDAVFRSAEPPSPARDEQLRREGELLLREFDYGNCGTRWGELPPEVFQLLNAAAEALRRRVTNGRDAAPSVGPSARIGKLLTPEQIAEARRRLNLPPNKP